MNQPIAVPRQMFINFTKGLLLDRDSEGKVLAVDEPLCERAMTALEDGEIVYLTVNDRAVTSIRLTDRGYTEAKI
jgi:hypothetical protein